MENENRITIPDFSKDDFLISSKPFQWIIDQADGNEFIKGQLVAQMAEKAKKLKVTMSERKRVKALFTAM